MVGLRRGMAPKGDLVGRAQLPKEIGNTIKRAEGIKTGVTLEHVGLEGDLLGFITACEASEAKKDATFVGRAGAGRTQDLRTALRAEGIPMHPTRISCTPSAAIVAQILFLR